MTAEEKIKMMVYERTTITKSGKKISVFRSKEGGYWVLKVERVTQDKRQ